MLLAPQTALPMLETVALLVLQERPSLVRLVLSLVRVVSKYSTLSSEQLLPAPSTASPEMAYVCHAQSIRLTTLMRTGASAALDMLALEPYALTFAQQASTSVVLFAATALSTLFPRTIYASADLVMPGTLTELLASNHAQVEHSYFPMVTVLLAHSIRVTTHEPKGVSALLDTFPAPLPLDFASLTALTLQLPTRLGFVSAMLDTISPTEFACRALKHA